MASRRVLLVVLACCFVSAAFAACSDSTTCDTCVKANPPCVWCEKPAGGKSSCQEVVMAGNKATGPDPTTCKTNFRTSQDNYNSNDSFKPLFQPTCAHRRTTRWLRRDVPDKRVFKASTFGVELEPTDEGEGGFWFVPRASAQALGKHDKLWTSETNMASVEVERQKHWIGIEIVTQPFELIPAGRTLLATTMTQVMDWCKAVVAASKSSQQAPPKPPQKPPQKAQKAQNPKEEVGGAQHPKAEIGGAQQPNQEVVAQPGNEEGPEDDVRDPVPKGEESVVAIPDEVSKFQTLAPGAHLAFMKRSNKANTMEAGMQITASIPADKLFGLVLDKTKMSKVCESYCAYVTQMAEKVKAHPDFSKWSVELRGWITMVASYLSAWRRKVTAPGCQIANAKNDVIFLLARTNFGDWYKAIKSTVKEANLPDIENLFKYGGALNDAVAGCEDITLSNPFDNTKSLSVKAWVKELATNNVDNLKTAHISLSTTTVQTRAGKPQVVIEFRQPSTLRNFVAQSHCENFDKIVLEFFDFFADLSQ